MRDDDLTSAVEARIAAKASRSAGDERAALAIAEWRQRQAADPEPPPAWGKWAEFRVTIGDGSPVAVLYDPTWGGGYDYFEFHSPVITDTECECHLEPLKNGRRPETPLEEWARAKAQRLTAKAKRERTKGAA